MDSIQKQIILNGEWLNDEHIELFSRLLQSSSCYTPRETWRIQIPDTISPIPQNIKHIQILHSCDDFVTNRNGHWVCSYYDTKHVYVYDSLNSRKLHEHHKIFLKKLFPFYQINDKSVKFPTVQSQPNCNDCGVFAIAFAITLFHGLKPEDIRYNHPLMRQHLLSLFEFNRLEHFPIITEKATSKIKNVSSDILQRIREVASKKRETSTNVISEKHIKHLENIEQYTKDSLSNEKENKQKEANRKKARRNKETPEEHALRLQKQRNYRNKKKLSKIIIKPLNDKENKFQEKNNQNTEFYNTENNHYQSNNKKESEEKCKDTIVIDVTQEKKKIQLCNEHVTSQNKEKINSFSNIKVSLNLCNTIFNNSTDISLLKKSVKPESDVTFKSLSFDNTTKKLLKRNTNTTSTEDILSKRCKTHDSNSLRNYYLQHRDKILEKKKNSKLAKNSL